MPRAGDEAIRDMAGHLSKDMLRHGSQIRTLAWRKAVNALSRKSKADEMVVRSRVHVESHKIPHTPRSFSNGRYLQVYDLFWLLR